MTDELAAKFLEAFPAFKAASPGFAKEMIAASQHTITPAGVVLQMEGDLCAAMGFHLEGTKRVYKTASSGREITLYEVGPGEICILNAASILSKSPCPAYAAATTEVEMLAVRAPDFRRLFQVHEVLRGFVFSMVNHGFATVMELVTEVAFQKMDQRLLDYLLEKSENSSLHTTHQTIANDLGTAREVVSRLLKELERQGRVRLARGRVELVDLG